MYSYRKAKTRFHKCAYCGRRIPKNDPETVVLTRFDGTGVWVGAWYCNGKCARAEYEETWEERHREDNLNDYITKNGGMYEL